MVETADIRNRTVEVRRMRAGDLLANPANWRVHTEDQRRTMLAVAREIGFVGGITAYNGPDGLTLIDGHLRAELFPDLLVDVAITDLDEDEAREALATYDPLSAMAGVDQERLITLLELVDARTESEDVAALLEALANGETSPLPPLGDPPPIEPPGGFDPLDPNAPTMYCCPSCGYGWNGAPRPGTSPENAYDDSQA
jgi:hypothetical protein